MTPVKFAATAIVVGSPFFAIFIAAHDSLRAKLLPILQAAIDPLIVIFGAVFKVIEILDFLSDLFELLSLLWHVLSFLLELLSLLG